MRGLGLIVAGFVAGFATAAGAESYENFQSPTGNIHCVIFTGYGDLADGVRCDIGDYTHSAEFPPPIDCEFDWGNAFWIGSAGRQGELACISDSVIDPSNPVLDYGQTVTGGGVTCTSGKTGMVCENAAGHGFSLARSKQSLF